MAIQNGIININRQLGDLVFYKGGRKDVVRQKVTHKQQTKADKKKLRFCYCNWHYHKVIKLNNAVVSLSKGLPWRA